MVGLLCGLGLVVGAAPAAASPGAHAPAAVRAQASTAGELSAAPGGAIIHVQSGLCLDGSASQGVRLVECNGSDYQNWTAERQDIIVTITYQLRNERTQTCLEGTISYGPRLRPCNNETSYDNWTYSGRELAPYLYRGVRCLDGSRSGGVQIKDCTGDNHYQQWIW